MTRNRYTQIGLDRIIKLDWLEKTAKLILSGNSKGDIKSSLQQDLHGNFNSPASVKRGSLNKTITILMKVWSNGHKELEPLQEQGLELLKKYPDEHHLVIHWGMIMASYPFWSAVAIQTGRLFRLQENIVTANIQRRIREQYGERQTVSRATQRVLRSFVDWNVLKETTELGLYCKGNTIQINDPSLIAWLVEAILHTKPNGSSTFKDLINSPSLFPFKLYPIRAEHIIAVSPRLEIIHHGFDDDLLSL